jgi:hypothetical protein
MQVELIENPLILRTLNTRTTMLALHDHQESSCAVRGDSLNDETKSSEEQTRLLMSRRAVLGEIGPSAAGAGQW